MAKKRMFTMDIVDTDAFLDMPLSTQALYFHLNMRADDDGFIGNPKRICRNIGASEDDLKLLIMKRFLLVFDDGVIVIKHWRMHNTLRADRYTMTPYQEELSMLMIKDNKSYSLESGTPALELIDTKKNNSGNQMATSGKHSGTTDIGLGLDIGLDLDKDKELVNKELLHNSMYVSSNDETPIEPVKKENINYQLIMDKYNEICISFSRLTKLSDARKKAIKARLNIYSIDDFIKMFQLAESSDFLKGKNNRDWTATFDWMIKDTNMAKILDGNYNKGVNSNGTGGKQSRTGNGENPLDIATRIQMVKDGRIKLEDLQNMQGHILDNEFGFE